MRFIEYMRRRKHGLAPMCAFEEAELADRDDVSVIKIVLGIYALLAAYFIVPIVEAM